MNRYTYTYTYTGVSADLAAGGQRPAKQGHTASLPKRRGRGPCDPPPLGGPWKSLLFFKVAAHDRSFELSGKYRVYFPLVAYKSK